MKYPSVPAFSQREMQILTAICDTLAPAVQLESDPHGLYARSASQLEIAPAVAEALQTAADPTNRLLAKVALTAIDLPLVNWAIGGPLKGFLELNLEQRTQVLRLWGDSPIPFLRRAYQAFRRLTLFLFYTVTPDQQPNPNWIGIGYDGPPQQSASPIREHTIKPLVVTEDTTLYTDVVIVGSGAGGGVVAGELTAAGLDVIVLEKAGYHAEPDFTGRELDSTRRLFENQGFLATTDLGIVVLAGSTLGGGTTVNWSASFRTRPTVLQEWEQDYGVTGYTGKDYQHALDAVSQRINVNETECAANSQNAVLQRGAQALGFEVGVIPRNVKGCGDCGFCNFGCTLGAKQGTLRTYLQDAYDRGARILVNAEAERVITAFDEASGVEAVVETPLGGKVNVTIKAKAVVVAAGSLHTPALLMRSGLTNPNIGRNLHLHPTSPIYGLHEQPTIGWSGVPMSRYIAQFSNLDGHGYGVTLETAPVHPGIGALSLGWLNGQQHKTVMSQLAHLANIIILTRDRDGGTVTTDKHGRPLLHYELSKYDEAHLLRGILEALKIQQAAGAYEISSPHDPPLVFRSAEGGSFDAYLEAVEARGLRKNSFALLSAHQMSSCRMGGNPVRGALDPTGETFEVSNLFVADGSALPTATGTNPMLTIMGVAHLIAQHIKVKLGK